MNGWVSEDGSYGVGDPLLFSLDALSDEQWDTLSELSDNSRYDYVVAVLNGDDLSEWEDGE